MGLHRAGETQVGVPRVSSGCRCMVWEDGVREWSRNPFGSVLSPEIRWSAKDAHLDGLGAET